jgi:hypothetical protein
MDTDPTLTRATDETAGQQPTHGSRPGEAASAPQAAAMGARRALRRHELERSRRTAMVMLNHLGMGIDGKLFSTAQDSVDRLKDPFLAMNRMQRELRRTIALAERLDEDEAARARRLAAEAAAADEAARDAERWEAGRAGREAEEARKAAIRRAVTEAVRDARGDDGSLDDEDDDDEDDDEDRETLKSLLNDLFDDYDTYESYDGDPVEIVAKLCAELGLKPHLDASDDDDIDDDDTGDDDPEAEEHALALEIARGYLERAGMVLAPAPVRDGHGPPDG